MEKDNTINGNAQNSDHGSREEDDASPTPRASSDEESGREHHNDIGDDGYLADDEESDNDVTSGQAPNAGNAEVVIEEENAVMDIEEYFRGVIIEPEYPHVQDDILIMSIDAREEIPPEL